MAEYAAVYGGPPAPSDPWPLFLAFARRTGQFWGRLQLMQMDAVSIGVGGILGDGSESQRLRSELEKQAYPTSKAATPHFLPNRFAENQEDPEASD